MRTLISKLKSRAGETLVESLMSIMVFTLASISMYTMVTTAADINAEAKELDRNMHEQIAAVDMTESSAEAGVGKVNIKLGDNTIDTIDVYIYRKDNNSMYAYYSDPAPTDAPTEPDAGGPQ